MNRDIQRWQREGETSTIIERTCREMASISSQIIGMQRDHDHRLMTMDGGPILAQTAAQHVAVAQPSSSSLSSPSLPILSRTRTNMNMYLSINEWLPKPVSKNTSLAIHGKTLDRFERDPPTAGTSFGPETTLEDVLMKNDAKALESFLKMHLKEAALGEYAWVAELKDIGYTYEEIAQLIQERENESPWIYFTPAEIKPSNIIPHHHLEGCVHSLAEFPTAHGYGGPSQVTAKTDQEIRRIVEELCGLGGIAPHSTYSGLSGGTASFEARNTKILLRHESTGRLAFHSHNNLVRIAERFSTAIRTVQDAGLCCNSFTVLRISHTESDGTCPELQLIRVPFQLATSLLDALKTSVWSGPLSPATSWSQSPRKVLQRESQQVLAHVFGGHHTFSCSTDKEVLHLASLALQFLCVGFLSYIQAHVGMIQPFFLDTPIREIMLLGSEDPSVCKATITARLVELTCLSAMCHDTVLAFIGPEVLDHDSSTLKYDVRARPEDILDTWGPGELVYLSKNRKLPLAIKIGGDSPTLDLTREIVIGRIVTINKVCTIDEGQGWKEASGRFEELGTYNSFSELAERQFGLQGGPEYLAITANMVWAKRRGRTVKARNLDREDNMLIPFLDFYWGVRVSFCTGVAQRVPLRQLVADLLPAFAVCLTSPQTKALWASLEGTHRILETLRDSSSKGLPLCSWFRNLPENVYRFALVLVRQILETLRDTGLSPDGAFFSVAWPHNGIVNRCIRISRDNYNKWTPVLADSDDCATFAYISTACLETANRKCQGPNPTWQGRIHLLETAVLCPTSVGPWTLHHEQTYFFQKLDNILFWVRAQKDTACRTLPATLVRLISIESLPRDVIQRLLFRDGQKRQKRLREKDLECVSAEIVYVS
ncbi:hypothetical protein HJFPF1_11869 [Paramyrothecium foliicola]|nr:hypothetical protein HJFPF1_11869 [Paramyrothecium foliicola]